MVKEEVVFKLKAKVLEGASLEKKPARGRADVLTNLEALMEDRVWGASRLEHRQQK